MKVGLSFSRCMRDLYEEKVKFDDVLVIVHAQILILIMISIGIVSGKVIHAADTHILNGLITKIKVMIFAN